MSNIFFTWILPPLMGAIIGYFTNWLAIKMIFRPHGAKYIFGLRLPFTPGLLPRERGRLAEDISASIAQELLHPDVIKAQLLSPSFQAAFAELLGARLQKILDRPLANLFSPEQGSSLKTIARALKLDDRLAQALDELIATSLTELGAQKLATILPPEKLEEILNILSDTNELHMLENKLHMCIAGLYNRSGQAQTVTLVQELVTALHLGPLLQQQLTQIIRVSFYKNVNSLEKFLDQADFRASLRGQLEKILQVTLERLGTVQKFFVTVGGYEETLRANMPATVEDVVTAIKELLHKENTVTEFAQIIAASLVEKGAPPLAQLLANYFSQEQLTQGTRTFFAHLGQHGEAARARILAHYATHKNTSLATLFALNMRAPEDANAASAYQSGPGLLQKIGRPLLAGSGQQVWRALQQKNIRSLLNIEATELTQASTIISALIFEILADEIPKISAIFDVKTMLVRRINDFNLEKLEQIILKIVKKELKIITLLGGFLGLLIGLIQSILSVI